MELPARRGPTRLPISELDHTRLQIQHQKLPHLQHIPVHGNKQQVAKASKKTRTQLIQLVVIQIDQLQINKRLEQTWGEKFEWGIDIIF